MSLFRMLAPGILLGLSISGQAASAVAPAAALAATPGMPLMQRFGPQDYNAAPIQLSVVRDRRGRMLFGNIEGILRYDGETWQHIDIPGGLPGYSMTRGQDGHIYVGSYDSFGWLVTDAFGHTRYQELMTQVGLKGDQRHVGTVWSVLATASGIYFRTEQDLHFIDYSHHKVHSWPLPHEARSFYTDGEAIFARYEGKGFGQVMNGAFKLVPGGARFAHVPLAAMLPMHGWRLLVGHDGLYRSDARGIHPLPGQPGKALDGHQPYVATRLPDGGLAIGCRDGSLFQFAPDMQLLRMVRLGRFSISALGNDSENGLWAATEGGLVRVAMPSPWSFLGGPQGINGTVFDFAWYDHALWLVGSEGISRLVSGPGGPQVLHTHWTEYEAFALLSTPQGLLIGHRDGLYVLDPGHDKPRELLGRAVGSVYIVKASRHDPNLVYALADHELFLLRLRKDHWMVEASLPTGGLSASDLIETAPGTLWVDNTRGGPQRWKIDTSSGKLLERRIFTARDGLDIAEHSGTIIFSLDHVLHVVSGSKGYRFDGHRFVADDSPPISLVKRPDELTISKTSLGTYAYTSRQLWHRAPGARTWRQLALGPGMAAGFSNLRLNSDGILRISTWTGLLQFDPRQHVSPPPSLDLRLDSLSMHSAKGDQSAQPLRVDGNGGMPQIPPGWTLTLHYSMVSMNGAQFRYRLPGVIPEWSEWRDGEIFLRALPAGEHELDIQARTRNNRDTISKVFRFETLPYWYQQWWAWLGGLLALIALSVLVTWAVLQRKTRRYRRTNLQLEERIAERTRELREANRQLAELATEDALTGIANRRALEQGMQREWERCMDERRALSALMIDIDHFKHYNDRRGHLEGDECLRKFARLLHDHHNPRRELLARYGGEEFALLLPGLTLENAFRRAEELRAGVAASKLGITVSIGVCGFVPHPDLHPESLLRRADTALYRAKHSGRNRVDSDRD